LISPLEILYPSPRMTPIEDKTRSESLVHAPKIQQVY